MTVGAIAGGLVHIGQIEVANKLRALVGAPAVVLPQEFLIKKSVFAIRPGTSARIAWYQTETCGQPITELCRDNEKLTLELIDSALGGPSDSAIILVKGISQTMRTLSMESFTKYFDKPAGPVGSFSVKHRACF